MGETYQPMKPENGTSPQPASNGVEATILPILRNLLDQAGAPYTDITVRTVAEQPLFSIQTEQSKALIGPRGETVRAIDYLVKRIAEQQGVEDLHFLIDVNDYRAVQIDELQVKARIMAERARSFQYDVELTPMSAYERLIVHATLAQEPDITTESHGEGRERRVVIKYTKTTTESEPVA